MLLQPNAVTLSPAAITQFGLVPGTAQALMFYGDGGFFVLTFEGQPIALTELSTTPTYTVYAGDISAYAGMTGEVRIQGNGTIDAISFAVPEPSALSLFGFGALCLHWLRRAKWCL